MNCKQDVVLAASGGYAWSQVRVWALSLLRSGFAGKKIVVVYDHPNKAQNLKVMVNLRRLGFEVVERPYRGSVYNQRFVDFSVVLQPIAGMYRYAVVTDIRDVFFQSNPMNWLAANLHMPMYAASEAIKYKDAPWNRENVREAYPELADRVMENCVYNVGVLAGEARSVGDMCLAIGLLARSSDCTVADQSGYNILLDMKPFCDATQFGRAHDGFACQVGSLGDPDHMAAIEPYLLEPRAQLDEAGVKTADGNLFAVVHQYDRAPAWESALRQSLKRK
jgi:hypothetical protein